MIGVALPVFFDRVVTIGFLIVVIHKQSENKMVKHCGFNPLSIKIKWYLDVFY